MLWATQFSDSANIVLQLLVRDDAVFVHVKGHEGILQLLDSLLVHASCDNLKSSQMVTLYHV